MILRGIDRSAVFFDEDDNRYFLESLCLAAGGFDFWRAHR
jgi:hypothetical protein